MKLENVFETMRSAGEESWHEEVATLTPLQLVEATFRRLFPHTFQYALPVWRHKVGPWLKRIFEYQWLIVLGDDAEFATI